MSYAKSWPFCLGLNVLRGSYIWMLFWMGKMYICLIQLGTEWVTSLTPKGRHFGNLLDTGYIDVVIMTTSGAMGDEKIVNVTTFLVSVM